MKETYVLELLFKTEEDKNKKLTLRHPKTDLTEEEIIPAMQSLVDANIFSAKGIDPFAVIHNARYVRTEVEDLLEA